MEDETDDEELTPIDIVVQWVEQSGMECSASPDSKCLEVVFDVEGFSYTATLSETNADTLTIAMAYELSDRGNELELRRRISKVDTLMSYGALIYDHERQVVLWRESICNYADSLMEPDDISDLITSGVASFEALRTELAGFMGLSVEDVRLANTHSVGRA
ncbi:MAG: hypothetical protein MUF19_01410 [Candidatus Pacebacteria bacterium]|jgi:hypothetical protein|nr:hypothetical protein [Candidatus Paceibacterota bacterium]